MYRLAVGSMAGVVFALVSALWLLATPQERQQTKAPKEKKPPRPPDVIFVPTPYDVVERMLEVAGVTQNDIVYDLGCGDGRIVVTAALKYGCRAVGFDIDPKRVEESLENVRKNKVEDLVQIEQQDIFTVDLSGASVVTLYLLPSLNVKLIPQLEKMKPGSRIVSHNFDMRGVIPDKVVKFVDKSGVHRTIYFWKTPLKNASEGEETSAQRYHKLEARAKGFAYPHSNELEAHLTDTMYQALFTTKDDWIDVDRWYRETFELPSSPPRLGIVFGKTRRLAIFQDGQLPNLEDRPAHVRSYWVEGGNHTICVTISRAPDQTETVISLIYVERPDSSGAASAESEEVKDNNEP